MNSSKSFSTLHYPFPRRVCSVLVVAIGSWLEVCVIDFFLQVVSFFYRATLSVGFLVLGLWPLGSGLYVKAKVMSQHGQSDMQYPTLHSARLQNITQH